MDERLVDVDTFIRNLEPDLGVPSPGGLHATTRFRDVADWTSLQALIVVAGFERDYGVTIPGEELSQAVTIEDLYAVVVRRMAP